MSLFLDGPASSIDDLAGYDSQLLDVASTERIDVTRKLSLAQDEIGVDLTALLSRSSRQNNAASLANVIITPALKLWHAYRSLELFYGDAYNSQLNDRYAGRRDQFRGMAQWAREKLIETGLGLTMTPVPRPGTPRVDPATGSLPEGTYFISVCYVNSSGEAGQEAAPAVITLSTGGFTVATEGIPADLKWNIYAGTEPDSLLLQNLQPIPPDRKWLQDTALRAGIGPRPGAGQTAAVVQPVPRVLQRG